MEVHRHEHRHDPAAVASVTVQRHRQPASGAVQTAGGASRTCLVDRSTVLGLQRAVGNAAVTSLLQRADPATAAAPAAPAPASSARTTYTGSNFVGSTVTADSEFVGALDKINAYAVANAVDVHVTSSYRTSTVVPGAIVDPATMSNHLAGHAIDMNVKYGPGKASWCNSAGLGGALPVGVKGFIEAVQGDAVLRWGGDFSDKDPVHIDDGLNVNDAERYKQRLEAMKQA